MSLDTWPPGHDLDYASWRENPEECRARVLRLLVAGSHGAIPSLGRSKKENAMSPKKPSPGRARDAGTGQYVKKSYAKKHPTTTVVEHDKKKRGK